MFRISVLIIFPARIGKIREFLNFSCIFFVQKCLAPLKLTELLRLCMICWGRQNAGCCDWLTSLYSSWLLQVPTVQSWLVGGNAYVDAVVVDHVIEEANRKLRDAVRRNFEEPEQHLQWFCKSVEMTMRSICSANDSWCVISSRHVSRKRWHDKRQQI